MVFFYFLAPFIGKQRYPCPGSFKVGFHILPVIVFHGRQQIKYFRPLHAFNIQKVIFGTVCIRHKQDNVLL